MAASNSVKGSAIVLKQIRELMGKPSFGGKELTAYVIFSFDAHHSEYPFVSDKRREFISGFTGSSGSVIVTQELALLWTDGRYFLQAEAELTDDWGMHKIGVPGSVKIEDWLVKNIPKGSLVGVNEKYIPYEYYKFLHKKLSTRDIVLHSVHSELVDIVWENYQRPMDPDNPIYVLPISFSGKSFQDKVVQVQSLLNEKADVLICYALDEFCWLFNLRGSDGEYSPVFKAYAVITRDMTHVFMKKNKLSPELSEGYFNTCEKVVVHEYDDIFSFLSCLSKKKEIVWFDRNTPAALVSCFPESQQVIMTSPIEKLKALKNEVEIQNIELACLKDSSCICEFFSILEKKYQDLDEISAADILYEIRRQQENFVSLSFPTISSSGPNAAVIHYRPEKSSARRLSSSEIYLCDSGSQFKEGTTDITRTIHFGCPKEEEIHNFTLVLKGHVALASSTVPEGIHGYQLDPFARQYLWADGLDYNHGTGHGIGMFLNVHEGPTGISRYSASSEVLAPGMLLSNEPGYYENGKYGIRIENMMIIESFAHENTKAKMLKFRTVSLIPFQKNLIDVSLLTLKEIKWIDDYHHECLQKLEPYMEKHGMASGLEWLKNQTKPLLGS